MPWQSFQTFGHIDQLVDHRVLLIGPFQLRIFFQSQINGHIQLGRNHFRHGIHLGIRQIEHPAHITDHAPGSHRTKGDDLNDPVFAVFLHHIIYDFLTPLITEIHINIRHGYPVRIQETFKKKTVFNRIEIRDFQTVGHQTSRCRTTARTNGNALTFGIVDKVPYNEEIIHKSHIFNGI